MQKNGSCDSELILRIRKGEDAAFRIVLPRINRNSATMRVLFIGQIRAFYNAGIRKDEYADVGESRVKKF